jgi:hypothetical protein
MSNGKKKFIKMTRKIRIYIVMQLDKYTKRYFTIYNLVKSKEEAEKRANYEPNETHKIKSRISKSTEWKNISDFDDLIKQGFQLV